jgi:hypothetical protein
MPHLRIREIMDELRRGGRLNADDWALLCEMNALFMSKPERASEPAIEVVDYKRAYNRERMRMLRQQTTTVVDNKTTKERKVPKERKLNNKKIQSPQTPQNNSALDTFLVFYQAYPKRRARAKAEAAYTKALSLGATADELLAGAKRYAAEVRGKESQFVAFPASWLNQQRWLDEPENKPTVVSGPWKPIEPEKMPEPVSPEELARRQEQIRKAKEALCKKP